MANGSFQSVSWELDCIRFHGATETRCRSSMVITITRPRIGHNVEPLIKRLVEITAGHDGEFVISTVGSEDLETGTKLAPKILHVPNGDNANTGLFDAIRSIATERRGNNCYIGIALMKSGFPSSRRVVRQTLLGWSQPSSISMVSMIPRPDVIVCQGVIRTLKSKPALAIISAGISSIGPIRSPKQSRC